MAITYVGGMSGSAVGSTTVGITISLTALVGGISSTATNGDLVLVAVSTGSITDSAIGVSTAGYTEVTELYSNGTSYDTNLSVSYKYMGSAPDASVVTSPSASTADAISVTVQVWRGVAPTPGGPFDATATTATGTGTGRPTPPAITPSTTGAVIVCVGASAAATGASYYSSSLGNFLSITSADTYDSMTGMGSVYWTSGTYTPSIFLGGTINAADSWAAATLALKPAVLSSPSSSVSPSPTPGWEGYSRGEYPFLPTGIDDLTNLYNATEYSNVDTKNDTRVDQTATGGKIRIHQFEDYVGSATNCSLEWEGQTDLAPSTKTVYLQIYNFNSSSWETVDSDNSSAVNTDFILSATIASLSNYKQGGSGTVIYCRVYQESASALLPVYGYFGGGVTAPGGTTTNVTERIVFSTGVTSLNTVSNLSVKKHSGSSFSDTLNYGYWIGGSTTNETNIADRITFSTGATSANTASNLSQARFNVVGLSNGSTYGYVSGGATGSSVNVVTTDRVVFSSGTTSAYSTSNLPQGVRLHGALSDGVNYGYYGGGYTTAYSNIVNQMNFSTEVISANTGGNLSSARYGVTGLSDNSTYGYFGGGYTGGFVNTVNRIVFSSGVVAVNTAGSFSLARQMTGSASDASTYGYWAGGYTATGGPNYVNRTDRITFSTGAIANNTSSNLNINTYSPMGLSDYGV